MTPTDTGSAFLVAGDGIFAALTLRNMTGLVFSAFAPNLSDLVHSV